MPRTSRQRGGLTQTRKMLIPLLQNQENNVNAPPLTVREVKEYLKQDLQESIRILKSKLDTLDDPVNKDDMLWKEYVKNEIEAMTYMSKGKSIKGLTGAIAAYNVFKKGQDVFKTGNRQKTPYPCGTVTCKERGQKIKEALTVLATFSPDSLGSFEMSNAFASAFDWMKNSKNQNIGLKYATFLGLPPDLIEDVTTGDATAATTDNAPNGSATSPPVTDNAPNGSATSPPVTDNAIAQPAQKSKGWLWGGKRTRRR